jgi:AcrR family transcriptional regulator
MFTRKKVTMPRAFSEAERARIDADLREAARTLIAQRGMRHISVEDLTRAVGISKGAFYLFYPAKEDLFFAVIAAWESDYQAALLNALGPSAASPQERVAALLHRAVTLWREHPLFRHFSREDYDALYRRLSPEQIAAAAQADLAFAAALIAHWQAAGISVRHNAELVMALMRAVFYVSLHADEFDPAIYPALLERLIAMTATELVT